MRGLDPRVTLRSAMPSWSRWPGQARSGPV